MLQQLFFGLVSLSLLFSAWAAPAAKSYSADSFDVDVTVQENGALLVTETLTLRFEGGPFTYVFRELTTDHTDGIGDIQASMDGVALPAGEEAGQVEVKGASPIRITWHFAPTTDSTHTYTLSYRVNGVVRQDGNADLLLWQALPDDHEYAIGSSTVRIHYPADVALLGAPEVRQGQASVETGDGAATFTARDIAADETLVVALRFPAGSLINAAPAWQTRSTTIDRSLPFAIIGSLVFAAIGVGFVFLYQARYRYAGGRTEMEYTQPPANLPPAIAGVLAARGSTQATWSYALGALFDLARRGVVRIEETERRSWFGGRDFVIKLQTQPAGLLPHEQGLLDALFRTKDGLTSAVLFSKLQNNIYQRLKYFSKPLEEELDAMGILDPNQRRGRSTLVGTGIMTLLLGIVVAILLGALLPRVATPWVLASAFGALVIGIVAIIAGASINPLSEEWRPQAEAWKQFSKHLYAVTRKREILARRELANTYLPYVAAFGLIQVWANYMKKQEEMEVPDWFCALAQTPDHSYGAFVAMMAAISSAGGDAGGGAAGAAAAGAAGGGASGAG